MEPEPLTVYRKSTDSAYVCIPRHSAKCNRAKALARTPKSQRRFYQDCDCAKYFYLYFDGIGKTISAHTANWKQAEADLQLMIDARDPVKRAAMEAEQERERQEITIEEALIKYTRMKFSSGIIGSTQTTIRYGLYGKKENDEKCGVFYHWIQRYNTDPANARHPVILARHITSMVMEEFAAYLKNHPTIQSDLTQDDIWSKTKSFVSWLVNTAKVLPTNPALGITKIITVSPRSRTGTFSEEQITQLMYAVDGEIARSIRVEMRNGYRARLRAFVQALRWTGMRVGDCLYNLRPENIHRQGDGTAALIYTPLKTKRYETEACVDLSAHLVDMLDALPMEDDSTPGFYFYLGPTAPDPHTAAGEFQMHNVIERWTCRLNTLFKRAGITEIAGAKGQKLSPHPHAFRDTYAVNQIRRGVDLYHVAKALGHKDITTTQRYYLPFIPELRTATLIGQRKGQPTAQELAWMAPAAHAAIQ